MGYSPWRHTEPDTTEVPERSRLAMHAFQSSLLLVSAASSVKGWLPFALWHLPLPLSAS